jgi:hypothetical protein
MTIRMHKPILFFKCVVLFVDLCVLRDLSSSIKHGHKAHKDDHKGHEEVACGKFFIYKNLSLHLTSFLKYPFVVYPYLAHGLS